MLLSRNKKNNVYPLKPRFSYIKWGLRKSKLYRSVFVMSSEKGLDSKWKEKFFPFIDVPISEATQLLFTKLPQSLKVYQFALNIWYFMHTFAKGSDLQCLNVLVEIFFAYLLCAWFSISHQPKGILCFTTPFYTAALNIYIQIYWINISNIENNIYKYTKNNIKYAKKNKNAM